MTKQEITFKIEWPQDETLRFYVLPVSEQCVYGVGFWRVEPNREAKCHIIIERPHEVCGRRWAWGTNGWMEARPGYRSLDCVLDAGHDGPCMMELGEAE